jgi:hypothetical protein
VLIVFRDIRPTSASPTAITLQCFLSVTDRDVGRWPITSEKPTILKLMAISPFVVTDAVTLPQAHVWHGIFPVRPSCMTLSGKVLVYP